MFGILNINKPVGVTSRDVVNRVQRLVKPDKAGHAGTLDPLAAGVLVVCIGPATRLIEYVQRMPKRYYATFLLGLTSETDDLEIEPTPVPNAPQPTREEVSAALPSQIGRIQQVPPAHSAIKLGGRRAYDLARQGKSVDLAARPVEVFGIELIEFDYPRLSLDIRCGSGTYIRSIGRDLARAMGTAAVMSNLTRTEVGRFSLSDACPFDELIDQQRIEHKLSSPLDAMADLPRLSLTSEELARIRSGQFLEKSLAITGDEAAAVDEQGRLVAVLTRHRSGQWKPARNFPEAE